MDDEQLRIAEVERMRLATELLDNPLMQAFFEDADKELWEKFKQTPIRDDEGRLKVRMLSEWLEKFRFVMTEHIQTGQMAAMQLEQMRERTLMDRLRGR